MKHSPGLTIRSCESAGVIWRHSVEVPRASHHVWRVTTPVEPGILSLGASTYCFLTLREAGWKLPRTPPLNPHLREQHPLHVHAVHRCDAKFRFRTFVWRVGNALA